MQVDKAAPMPVPVQIRMPRLYMAEACPTAAVQTKVRFYSASALGERTKLQLACPEGLRRVLHEAFREVACHTR